MTSESRMEWVEIIEPRTKEHMYANLTTGECVWDPPPGVPVKKTDNNQWWELFDQNTSRFYYYNATSQKTVWHRPTDCDIIPLAKLQTLKQNTEPVSSRDNADRKATETKKKETVSTQTQTPITTRVNRYNNRESPSSAATLQVSDGCKAHGSSLADPQMSPSSPSPSARRHHHHHHHHHHNSSSSNNNSSARQHRHETPSSGRRQHNHSQDSGRSSDSSVSHSRTSLESSSYRLLDSPYRQHHRGAGPTASPGGATLELRTHKSGTIEGVRTQKAPEVAPPVGLSLSTSTPVFKKKTYDRGEPEKNKNGGSSPYRDFEGYRQEAPPYRPPDMQFAFKPQGDKYGSLVDSSGRSYQRKREKETQQQRERVNSLDKSSAYYAPWPKEQPSAGSIGRRHHYGCSASLSEANVREMYGAMIAEPPKPFARGNQNKQKCLDVSERQSDRRTTKCNNALESTQQPIARSYSFVQQQKQQHKLQQQQSQSRSRRDKDDDSMHERYLVGQNQLGDLTRQRLDSNSSNSSSNSSNTSSNSAICDDETHDIDEGKKRRSNGNPSPPASPYYGNILVDPDHLLPLQHYILQQAKLSAYLRTRPISIPLLNGFYTYVPNEFERTLLATKHRQKRTRPNSFYERSRPNSLYAIDSYLASLLQSELERNLCSAGCYKFGDPLLTEEGDDSLDEEGGHAEEARTRGDDDSDDQFADDEAASNQGDSSSQEYLEDHYADLGSYDTAGLATYYNTTETLTRSRGTPPPPPNIASQAEARENVVAARPVSLPAPSLSGLRAHSVVDGDECRRDDAGSASGGDIEKYAQDNLNLNCGRAKGLRMLFRKKASVRDILSWSKDPIPQPMLVVVEGEKLLKREACNLFRLVQVYMGDRKANVGMTLDGVAMELVNTVFSKPPLRDELYVQICRQTTENPRKESLRRGWELLAICLAFVPPSATFEPYLEGYMNRHRDPNFQFPEVAKWPIHVQVSHYATVACQRLRRIGAHGKRQPRKASTEDIDQARIQIFRASMFGATLSEVMALQRDRFPKRKLPWIQTTLTRQVLIRGGTQTEGIFRVSADADEVNSLKSYLDRFEEGDATTSQDAHAPASLLKLWVRELYEPLIPDSFYTECVSMRHDEVGAAKIVSAIVDRLPDLNKRVLCHLIQFLQIFARPEVVVRTKMDASNLAMVMAPNILRCTSQEPRIILENTRKEMAFVRALIETLDTSWVDELH